MKGKTYFLEPEKGASLLDEAVEKLRILRQDNFSSLIVERVVIGIFFTGVKLSTGCTGVAYTPPETARAAGRQILKGSAPNFRGQSAQDILNGKHTSPFANVVRLALINALSVPLMREYLATGSNGLDLTEFSDFFVDRKICMVGAIMPILKKLDKITAAGIRIVERKTDSIPKNRKMLLVHPENTAEALGWCDTAVITGASIANGSFEYLVSKVKPDAAIAVVGPTAGFIPLPLFRRRVAIVSTVTVTDGDMALDILAEGGGAYQLFGKCVKKINLLNRDRMFELGMQF
ncbi:DUF364 domain-containing protein [Desulforegula conservatrix]|uniref:DUF364 domain-containing protein n=1 Tax=Desulforegula conservatrix TaxID=153026 RepID=UPI0004124F41|nr:DUF364 domain-containing protein [Desulforegula conservatrix]